MTFPGDVSITRHVEVDEPASGVEAAVTGDGGSGDEDR